MGFIKQKISIFAPKNCILLYLTYVFIVYTKPIWSYLWFIQPFIWINYVFCLLFFIFFLFENAFYFLFQSFFVFCSFADKIFPSVDDMFSVCVDKRKVMTTTNCTSMNYNGIEFIFMVVSSFIIKVVFWRFLKGKYNKSKVINIYLS